MRILVGDIGGTNTRLLLTDSFVAEVNVLAEGNYQSQQYSTFHQVIACFLSEHSLEGKIDAACFAVAGPVKNGASKITNLPWQISEAQISTDLKIPVVKLINDFAGVALGIPKLGSDDVRFIQQGSAIKEHPDAAIIGAGTGFGVSHRTWMNNDYQILASETGHACFAPSNLQQTQLLAWLQKQHQPVCIESIVSGRGLFTIYQYLRDEEMISESNTIKQAMLDNDPSAVISQYGLQGNDKLCVKTLDLFTEIYGSATGDAVLNYYPIDEVYIAGGIAPKIQDKISSPLFLDAFLNKGRMTSNMHNLAIKLILNDKVGLYGALSYLEKNLLTDSA